MSRPGGARSFFPLQVLLFTAGGIRFGACAEQVLRTSAWAGGDDREFRWFHASLGLAGDSGAGRPVVASVRTKGGGLARVIFDGLDEIVEAEAGDIRPFPPLLERSVLGKGLWGVLARQGSLILLVDFQRMENN